jgi:aldehyde dehydrogenase (NAD+)
MEALSTTEVSTTIQDAVSDQCHPPRGPSSVVSGTVFSRDTEFAYDVACRIRAGHVGVNGLEMPASVPFGGHKMSGIGRGGGHEGLESYLETKAIFMPTQL